MRMQTVVAVWSALLAFAGPAWAQTDEIQKQIDKKLQGLRKEQAALDELLAQALKNNPDIRVAEAKMREADAELYRARVNILNRVVIQLGDIRSARAAANEATARYEREVQLSQRGAISEADLRAARAAMLKFQGDL